jgi:plastocyanin
MALSSGATFEFTFDEPGTYPYFCSIHPSMTGTVEVTG